MPFADPLIVDPFESLGQSLSREEEDRERIRRQGGFARQPMAAGNTNRGLIGDLAATMGQGSDAAGYGRGFGGGVPFEIVDPEGGRPIQGFGGQPGAAKYGGQSGDTKLPETPAGPPTMLPTAPSQDFRTQLNQRLADMTGVAYGQMPFQFDPRLRSAAIEMLTNENAAANALASQRSIAEMQGRMSGDQLGRELQSKRELAELAAKNSLDVARVSNQPQGAALKNDLVAKIVGNAIQGGVPIERVIGEIQNARDLIDSTMLPPATVVGDETRGWERGAVAAPGIAAMTPADRSARMAATEQARAAVNSMKDIISLQKQGPAGTVTALNEQAMTPENLRRLAKSFVDSTKAMPPEARDELMKSLRYGESGGLGDINKIRESTAVELARANLMARNFGLDLRDSSGMYPGTYKIVDPADQTRVLAELGIKPKAPFEQKATDFVHQAYSNLGWRSLIPGLLGAETIGELATGRPTEPPYDQITIPGRGTIPFDRFIRPALGDSDAAREEARRAYQDLLEWSAALSRGAQAAPQPQPQVR